MPKKKPAAPPDEAVRQNVYFPSREVRDAIRKAAGGPRALSAYMIEAAQDRMAREASGAGPTATVERLRELRDDLDAIIRSLSSPS